MESNSIRLGIIGAMDIEVEQIKESMQSVTTERCMGMEFHSGTLCGLPAVAVVCGMGKVNAALCTCVLIEHFDVTHIVNTGVAGSLDSRIDIGDLVISTEAVEHDMDVSPLGYALGQVPGMDVLTFPTDDRMLAMVRSIAESVAPNIGVHEGPVASGDVFVSSAASKDRIVDTFGALCCEMEGAAIAHACYLAGVPVAIARTISDKADGSATLDYPTFKVEAANLCAGLIIELARQVADLSTASGE